MDLSNPLTSRDVRAGPERFLSRVDDLLDWVELAPLMDAISGRVQARLPLSAVKLALIKQWYGLADSELEFAVMDRASFRGFVGFIGDGGVSDAEIISELRGGYWRNQVDLGALVMAVEDQLRDQGYTVRHGRLAEASLAACTESGMTVPDLGGVTTLHAPGELGRMLEAATAKALAEGRMPTGPQEHPTDMAAASPEPLLSAAVPPAIDAPSMVEVPPAPAPMSAGVPTIDTPESNRSTGKAEPVTTEHIRAVLNWPWGQKTELTEHLNIGREFGFSPFARELAPYTHMSRRHAELLVYGDGVWVRDLGSRNGTFVNGEEVPKGQAFLIDSDSELRFGPNLAVHLKISA
jgi:hypothetical protein